MQYSSDYKRADPNVPSYARINYVGNNAKSMHISVHDSLRKLRTTYIDILYVHWWGYDTSIPEVMGRLHDLVAAGKVLYLGVSDAPAWVVAQANQWAADHGKTPFCVYQGRWNVMDRAFERDILPMARQWGMALAPWNVLAAGRIRTDAEEERRKKSGEGGRDTVGAGWERSPEERRVCQALEKIANDVGGYSITAGKSSLVLDPLGSLSLRSRHRIPLAQDALRLPHCRRSQGRAPDGQHQCSENFPLAGTDEDHRGPRSVRSGLPAQYPRTSQPD